MKKGDTIRFKGTEITGKITAVFSEHLYRANFNVYGTDIIVRDTEIELIASAPITPIPCIECGHAHQVTNEDETEFAVYCDCGIAQTGETKEEAIANWNQFHANIGRCTFDE